MTTTPPRKPGLELLIRRPRGEGGGGPGFELKTLASDEVFLRMLPRRTGAELVEEAPVHDANGPGVMMRFRVDGVDRYVRFSERERFLYDRMDGVHAIREIATAYVFRFGSFDVDGLRRFLSRARRLGLVSVRRPGWLHRRAERHGGWARLAQQVEDRLSFRYEAVDGAFSRVDRILGWLMSPWLSPLWAALVGVGLVAWSTGRFDGSLAAPREAWRWLAVFACWLPAAMVVHELAHGVACKRLGRRVKAVGFTFIDDLAPTFYVDVTDTLMAPRVGRVAVSLAGPAVNLCLGAAAAVGARALAGGPADWALLTLADVHLFLALYTLWPFHPVREDGYLVLCDLGRVPALRAEAWRLLRRAPGRAHPGRVRALLWAYALGVALTCAAAVGLAGWVALR